MEALLIFFGVCFDNENITVQIKSLIILTKK